MNILAITQIYPQTDDVGNDRPTSTVEYFSKQWVEMGHRVTVIHCPSKFPIIFYKLPKKVLEYISNRRGTTPFPIAARKELHRDEFGIRIHRLPMMKIYPGMAFSEGTMKDQADRICKLIDSEGFKPDLVIGHFANPSLELVVDIAEHYKVPSSMVFHHDCTKGNIKKYRIKELIGKIGAVGGRSIGEAQEIQKDLELKELPFVCYSGAPNDAVENCEKTCSKHDYSQGVRHIYVGSMLARKHVDTLIKAFGNHYSDSKTSLEIIGGGQEEENLKKLVKERGLEEKVRFLGTMPRNDVMKKMHNSQIFTMVSHAETFGMVYIEAMLQGCLVIASRNEGFDGIIKDGYNGFLCKAGDEEELKQIFEKIDSMSIEERNKIGQNAIETALGFSERAVAERYLDEVMQRNAR